MLRTSERLAVLPRRLRILGNGRTDEWFKNPMTSKSQKRIGVTLLVFLVALSSGCSMFERQPERERVWRNGQWYPKMEVKKRDKQR